jgi:hypothetical protein
MDNLLTEIKACTVCVPHLELGPNPILTGHPESKIVLIGQASEANGTNWGQWTTVWSYTTKADLSSSIREVYFSDIKIYPNPTYDIVTFETNSFLLKKPFKLLDNTGKEIFSGLINSKQVSIRLNGLSTGIYFLQIGDYPQQTFKLLKE